MAVTRTLAQLAGDLRIGDGSTEPTGAIGSVLARIDATARAMVLAYAPLAPDAIHDEAFVRVAGWLYDSDPSGAAPGGPSALRASGAAALLAPYRIRRAGAIERLSVMGYVEDSRMLARKALDRFQLWITVRRYTAGPGGSSGATRSVSIRRRTGDNGGFRLVRLGQTRGCRGFV